MLYRYYLNKPRIAYYALRTPAAYVRQPYPNGIRTRAAALKGRCPRPLDDGGLTATAVLPVAPAVGDRFSIGDGGTRGKAAVIIRPTGSARQASRPVRPGGPDGRSSQPDIPGPCRAAGPDPS